jgi:uncharacterized protein YjbJ (UPF0337 family)
MKPMKSKHAPNLEGTADVLEGKWHQLRGQVRERFGKLTDDDFARLSGKTEELRGVLQERYGYGQHQAQQAIDEWMIEKGSTEMQR